LAYFRERGRRKTQKRENWAGLEICKMGEEDASTRNRGKGRKSRKKKPDSGLRGQEVSTMKWKKNKWGKE